MIYIIHTWIYAFAVDLFLFRNKGDLHLNGFLR